MQHSKTWGFPSQFVQIDLGVNGHPTRALPEYYTPEQVSDPEPPDSRPYILTTTLLQQDPDHVPMSSSALKQLGS